MKLGRPIMPCHQRMMVKFQKENRANPTEAESRMMGLLDEIKEPYIFEKGFFSMHSFYLVDFYLPKPRKICLEIDGIIHQWRQKQDRERDAFLKYIRKLRVVHLSNDRVLTMTTADLKTTIRQACG